MVISSARHVFGRVRRALEAAIHGLVSGGWKLLILRLALIAIVVAGVGFVASWSGLAPVSAHSKHWPITRWFLHFSMRHAVKTRSAGIEVPPLDDEAKIMLGAGHYATSCAPCHGAPGVAQSYVANYMTPEPPLLSSKLSEWKPEHLFWIVRHGVKFSAMPAWPSHHRKDEIWAVVAFLQQLPEMTPARYQELAYGPVLASSGPQTPHGHSGQEQGVSQDAFNKVLDNCSRCHGRDGLGRGLGTFPKLAGQKVEYLRASLEAYANGERHSGVMQPIAANLNRAMIDAVAEHYASFSTDSSAEDQGDPTLKTEPTDEHAQSIARGEAIAVNGLRAQGVPPCSACHGEPHSPQNKIYPRLAGQYPHYLQLQLFLLKSNHRGGTPYSHIMQMIAQRLTKEQVTDLANYFGSQKWGNAEQSPPHANNTNPAPAASP